MSPDSSTQREGVPVVSGRILPAVFILHGAALVGGFLGGMLGSSTASKVFWMSFPVLPGAVAGVLGFALPSPGSQLEWVPPVILAGAMTLGLLRLVDRARTWENPLGICVVVLAALVSGAEALWVVLMMRA